MDYRFTFERPSRRYAARLGGTVLADSRRAVVLRETRLPPVVYFPREDVRMDLMRPSENRSYCPLRGTASYYSAALGGRLEENLAWSYEDPLAEAEAIRGHLAFYAERLEALTEDDAPVAVRAPVEEPAYANPLLGWLLAEAPGYASAGDLTAALAARMVAAGVPLMRLAVLLRTLHPELVGITYTWRRRQWAVEETRAPRSVLETPEYLESPVRAIFEGAGGVRRRLEGPGARLDYGIVRELRDEGATDYVAMPLVFSDGSIHLVSLASDQPGGFRAAHLGNLYEVLGVLGRLYEAHAMRRTAADLLDTYLGRHAGERVLNGRIRRGDGENIRAVIWFCDLRDSTPLTRALGRQKFLALLNEFFDAMAGAVLEHGGQVLRFIGDAALAIFPIEDGRGDARAKSLAAARAAAAGVAALNAGRRAAGAPEIRFGIGLHVGEVTYGNIGTAARLEFTVIGDAANFAARVEAQSRELGEPIVVSAAFAEGAPDAFRSLGRHLLKGVEPPQELFAPAA